MLYEYFIFYVCYEQCDFYAWTEVSGTYLSLDVC